MCTCARVHVYMYLGTDGGKAEDLSFRSSKCEGSLKGRGR